MEINDNKNDIINTINEYDKIILNNKIQINQYL